MLCAACSNLYLLDVSRREILTILSVAEGRGGAVVVAASFTNTSRARTPTRTFRSINGTR